MDQASEPAPQTLHTADGATIAYHRLEGKLPGIVFLGGFASDMTGTKALALEAFARERGHAFVRFDYQGHGQSSGRFEDGTIGQWSRDAIAVLDELTEGPQILVGSSMGGWIMLLVALARASHVAGLIGIAAAPDFTEDLMWERMDDTVRATIERDGVYYEPSEYGEPLPITRHLIEEGRSHLLLRGNIPLACPVRLLQGMDDRDVPWEWALKLQSALQSEDVETVLIKHGDHRLSEPHDIQRLRFQLDRLLHQVEGVVD
ncbi:alpha/beta hydrolase [Ferruginivarius sediminum]|uniref:Alpha/beta hydrolase n=1 Tax=Ferruginivarius sediminum TaxID=2661937 RepID=A0A369T858_9PROT|nr:alpha/beta hydrolase [Ferruginivarius sediminum]RDD61511.1 alpha/beta hydrolase [Ferruginivarius sediminum]